MNFITYLRKFEGYKWYKPVLEGIIAGIFWLIATGLCIGIALLIAIVSGNDPMQLIAGLRNAYDGFDAYTLSGAISSLGSVACLIPAIAIAIKIVKLRPFHTVASSCGGFSFKIFARVMVLALVIIGIPVAINAFADAKEKGSIEFTILGFIACIILGVLQCCGEEFMFRGIILQTIGSWVKKPVLAMVIQTLLFVVLHPYGLFGKLEVGVYGLMLGLTVLYTNGLEASCAAHIANNMVLFIINGFGFKTISSNGSGLKDVIIVAVVNAVYLAILIFMDKKFNWFERTSKETTKDTDIA